MQKHFYITTTLPYVNADPHIGFAMEIIQADTLARFKKFLGYEVFFNTGTDEHGQKIYKKALEENKDPQLYCDEYAKKFENLKTALNLSYTNFVRTTDKHHIEAAQEFWRLCLKNGDIYKKIYKIKYCVGCELEKTESELVNGCCPLHPNQPIEIIEEENYFFRFSKYQNTLLDLYKTNPAFVLPDSKLKEIENFVTSGLEDFSISRLKSKMPWGVDVPDDPEHVMYVWFDALINYISTLGWPFDSAQGKPSDSDGKPNNFEKFWGTKDNPNAVQVAGKDNLRQQSAMWQAMLISAGLPTSRQIIIHGFITADGKKMSKSLGNVVSPYDLVQKYGTDPVRYYLLKEIPGFDDGDFSHSRMLEVYNSDLANELGNLIMRITTLAEKDQIKVINHEEIKFDEQTEKLFDKFQFNFLLENIWQEIKKLNKTIDDFTPWNKTPDERKDFLLNSLEKIYEIGYRLQPFLPDTADKVIQATSGKIKKIAPLFPRI